MIVVEPFRTEMLTPSKGMIGINEQGQKFKVMIASRRLITLEPYEGRVKESFFVYMGEIPEPKE
jgi:hypothetical protein